MPLSGLTIGKQLRQANVEKKAERQILVFTLGRKELGLDLGCVREVLRLQEIHPLPKAPPFIEGVIPLRGRLIPLIDLGKKLHAEPIEVKTDKRIIICRMNRMIVGLTVESVKEVVALPREDIQSTPEVVSLHMETDVLSGIGRIAGRIIPILDLEYVLNKKEIAELSTLEP